MPQNSIREATFRSETRDSKFSRTRVVYTINVKNVTLSADEELIEKARAKAQANQTTLNSMFRQWLEEYTAVPKKLTREEMQAIIERVSSFRLDKMPTRDEMHER